MQFSVYMISFDRDTAALTNTKITVWDGRAERGGFKSPAGGIWTRGNFGLGAGVTEGVTLLRQRAVLHTMELTSKKFRPIAYLETTKASGHKKSYLLIPLLRTKSQQLSRKICQARNCIKKDHRTAINESNYNPHNYSLWKRFMIFIWNLRGRMSYTNIFGNLREPKYSNILVSIATNFEKKLAQLFENHVTSIRTSLFEYIFLGDDFFH